MVYSYLITPGGPTSASNVLGVSSVLPALCIIAVILRLNARRLQKVGIRADDWIMLPALALVVGMGLCGILGVKEGVWGYNTPSDATLSSTVFEGKLLEAFQYLHIVALALIKLGALAFYARIFSVKDRRSAFDTIRITTVIIVALWAVAMILMNSLQCGTHISALWDGADAYVLYCGRVQPYEQGFAITNALLDLWVILLPVPKIFTLQTTTARKFAVSGVFLLALVGLASSIARVAGVVQEFSALFAAGADYRLLDTLQIFWSNLEAGLSLLAVNLPSLWYYATKTSPDRLLASLRSVFSLQSLRGDGSQESSRAAKKDASLKATASMQAIFPPGERSEAFAMHDVEAQKEAPRGVIVVSSTYSSKG